MEEVSLCSPQHKMDIYKLIEEASYVTSFPTRLNPLKRVSDTDSTEEPLPFSNQIYDILPRSHLLTKYHAWNPLGIELMEKESICRNVNGEEYFTIRIDGKNFTTICPKLKSLGLFSDFYTEYNDMMIQVCNKLMNYFSNCLFAYSQSDEITLLFSTAPYDVNTKEYGSHIYKGRHDKLITLVSCLATQYFCKLLFLHCLSKENGLQIIQELPDITFDARKAIFSTLNEAFKMILWRSYDSSVNGVSNFTRLCCCHFHSTSSNSSSTSSGTINSFASSSLLPLALALPSDKDIEKLNSIQKLLCLHAMGTLAHMTDHQKYGTLFCRHKMLSQSTMTHIPLPTDNSEVEFYPKRRKKMDVEKVRGCVVTNTKKGMFNLFVLSCGEDKQA